MLEASKTERDPHDGRRSVRSPATSWRTPARVGVTLPKGVSRLRLAMSVNSTGAGLPGGISPVLRWTQK